MKSQEFLRSVEIVLKHEGGYVFDPKDMGGETNFGISKRSYPHIDIKNLTREQAIDIYYKDFWIPSKAELLPKEIQCAYFNFAVNFGLAGAAKVLQRAAGVEDDGKIGSQTLRAVEKVTLEVFLIYVMDRYMRVIAARHTNAKFARGWSNRVLDFLKK